MKLALALAAAAVLSIGAMGGVVAWRHAHPGEHQQELRWLDSYSAWAKETDDALERRNYAPVVGCERRLRSLAGPPPTHRLARAMESALSGCRSLRRSIVDAGDWNALSDADLSDWYATRSRVLGKLLEDGGRNARAERSSTLAAHAAPYAEIRPVVFCWSEGEWDELSEEWSRVRSLEYWIVGFVDWTRDGIHLAPTVCNPLKRFFGSSYAPSLNVQSYELAEALVTLAHEAEHLRSPRATEAQVECVALQRVRDLVRDAGRPRSYEDLMTGLAWDVGYPTNLPQYKTNTCRNDGPLDVRPETDVWP